MKRELTILFMSIFFFLAITDVEGQRRRRNRDNAISNATRVREAEYYFTEAEKYFILEDYAKALALFQRSIELDPNNSAAYYKKAQIEFENEELEKALKNAEVAVEKDPGNKYYYLLIIEIKTQSGEFDSATETYEKMIEQVPGTDNFLYEVAAIYLFQKKYDLALQTFDRLEKRFGVSEEIALQRHRVYNQMGQKDKAVEELQALVTQFPLNENYPLALAEYYLNLDQSEKSKEVLNNMIELFPGNARASLLLGEIFRKDNQFVEALPFLKSAFENAELQADLKVQLIAQYKTLEQRDELDVLILQLCETLVGAHSGVANTYAIYGDFLLEKGKPDEAAEKYMQSLELDESNFSVWQNLILINSRQDDFEDVILNSDKAMVIFPNQGILYYLSGYAHVRQKMYQEAIYLLKSGIRLTGDNPSMVSDFNSLLGEAYNGVEDYENSDKAYEEALAFNEENAQVLNNYSYYLALRNENLDKAEKMASKLVKLNPNDANFLDTYAWVLYTRKKYKEARKIAEKAVDSGKAKAVHYEHYGDILFKLGDVDGAVLQWQKAKGLDSSLKLIDKKIADRKLYEK